MYETNIEISICHHVNLITSLWQAAPYKFTDIAITFFIKILYN